MVYLKDKLEVDLQEKNVNLCRVGIYEYLASELCLSDRQPNDIIKILRDNKSLEQVNSIIKQYGTIPILINHPKDFVSLNDNLSYKRGGVGNTAMKDVSGISVVSGKLIAIGDDVKDMIVKGTEVSLGYTAELVPSNNSLYDFTLDIKDVNHLAIVHAGRAGAICSIQDEVNYKKLILDKLQEETMNNIKDTEAVAEEKTIIDEQPIIETIEETVENQEAIESDVEDVVENAIEEAVETKVQDSVNLIDEAKIFNDGYSKAKLEYNNAIQLSRTGFINTIDLIDNDATVLIDNALEKIYNKKIADNKQAYIDLAVAQYNNRTWDLSDTKFKNPVKQDNLQGIFIKNKLGE